MTTNGHTHDHPTPAGGGEPAPVRETAHARPALIGAVPEAESIAAEEDLTPNPEGPELPPGLPGRPEELGRIPVAEFPNFPPFPRPCKVDLTAGCYRITYRPNALVTYRGTLRVEISGSTRTISGDLYRYMNFPFPVVSAGVEGAVRRLPGDEDEADAGARTLGAVTVGELSEMVTRAPIGRLNLGIPIYPRNRYYSYLKVTGVKQSREFGNGIGFGNCLLTLTAEEYVYTQPPAGQFNGTFPAAPGTRTVQIVVKRKNPAPIGIPGPYFEGNLYEGGVDKGEFTMGWVSSSFRKANIEIDTLTGAVAPASVGADDFRTVFASAGWDVTVSYDQVNVPVPAAVADPNACWSAGNLHDLMTTVRNPATNLDQEWRLHLIVVPAQLGCGRGVMYDQIVVPREGVASFCNDGYPANESGSFGTAANQQQRDVPRAFLRSACHELGHGFNQVHQEGEGGADNSIMTTTPSVANVLGGPPGIFPDDINLAFNAHVRRHLIHWPDPLVRPGGHTFGSGHGGPAIPSPDRQYFTAHELELRIDLASEAIEIGEPLKVAWTLTNNSQMAIPVPTDVSLEAQHAVLSVTRASGEERVMRSFIVRTDDVTIDGLQPAGVIGAETRVFWSANDGFAFEIPGRHRLDLEIAWSHGGVSFGARATADVWVNYPQTQADNDAARLLLAPEVGKYVALGGDAPHLTEAVDRLSQLAALDITSDAGGGRPKALRGYDGILPTERELSDERRDRKPARTR